MFDKVCVFTLSGVVLWSSEVERLREDVISGLVRDILLPSRPGTNNIYDSGATGYVTRWAVSNPHGIVAAVVLAKSLANSIPYADSLASELRDAFISRYGESLRAAGKPVSIVEGRTAAEIGVVEACAGGSVLAGKAGFNAFNADYAALLARHEGGRGSGFRQSEVQQVAPSAARPAAAASAVAAQAAGGGPSAQAAGQEAGKEEEEQDGAPEADGGGGGGADDRIARIARLKAQAAAARGGRKVGGGGGGGSVGVPSPAKGSPAKGQAGAGGKADDGKKTARKWDDSFSYSEKGAAELDRSKDKGSSGAGASAEPAVQYSGTGASGSGSYLVEEDDMPSAGGSGSGWLASASSLLSGITHGKPLTRETLGPVADSLRTLLQGKNVATEVSNALVDAVAGQLEGTVLDGSILSGSTSSRTADAVTAALRSSIERVLTPRTPVDILREVRAKRATASAAGKAAGQRDPYVIVFCGVNGVGKSTTLSKIAFHLKDHGHSVMMAACDSFRAGAVEQLKKHADRLQIQLHEAGYAKDPVVIAADAIRKAREADIDVVLVDTAGRMQNNTQLMAQLAKLVAVNAPDRVLFVGEALVGNDGVDQLMEFNRALTDLAQTSSMGPRIDGIVLTKFDTVDDKVGAALSMTYLTGIPIVFLGVGQQYPDLRKLNTVAVVKSLLAQ